MKHFLTIILFCFLQIKTRSVRLKVETGKAGFSEVESKLILAARLIHDVQALHNQNIIQAVLKNLIKSQKNLLQVKAFSFSTINNFFTFCHSFGVATHLQLKLTSFLLFLWRSYLTSIILLPTNVIFINIITNIEYYSSNKASF